MAFLRQPQNPGIGGLDELTPAEESFLTTLVGNGGTPNLTSYFYKPGISGGQTAIGGTGVTDILKLQGTTGNGTLTSPSIQLLTGNNGATVVMTVLGNGNVGIGTTAPGSLLTLNNGGTFTLAKGLTFGDGDTGVYESADDVINIYNLDTITANISKNIFNMGSGTTGAGLVSSVASETNPTLLPRSNDTDTGIGRAGADVLSLIAGGTNVMNITSGNVGIGTTTPTAVLNIKKGTATAHTQPLQLTPTAAVLLTTPELGSIEVDATNLYYTATGTLRESIHFGSKGSATLTAGTTTTITTAGAKTTSVILIQSTSAAITLLGVYVSTKANGSFVLTHTTAAGIETFDWVIIN